MDFSRRRSVSKLEGPSSTLIDISARDVTLTVFCDSGDRTEKLQEAFEAFKAIGSAQWVTQDDLKTLEQSANYICDPFEGEIFEYLRNNKASIYGPLVLLRCIRDKRPLPLATTPVYSQSMKDVVVTFSSVVPTLRTELTRRIEYMGGRVEAALNNTVTHVVSNEVGSKKYIVGAQRGLAIQTTAWIDKVWEETQFELKHAVSVANDFKTPVFANLTITSSGLNETEKDSISKLILENGGAYTGKLTKTNTHLIIREPKGAKFKAAMNWQLHIVSPEWVSDSVRKSFMIDPMQYKLTDVSLMVSQLDTSTTSVASSAARSVLSEKTNIRNDNHLYSEVLKLSRDEISIAGQFLDGCLLHVFGIRDKALVERLELIINQAGGLRSDVFNDQITHVITMPSSDLSELNKLIADGFASPTVVLPTWLAACVRQKMFLQAGPFVCPGFDASPEEDLTCLTNATSVAVSSVGEEQKGCLKGKVFCLAQDLLEKYLVEMHDLPILRDSIASLGGLLVEPSAVAAHSQDTVYFVYKDMICPKHPEANAITILHIENVIRHRRWVCPTESPFYQVVYSSKSELPNAVLSGVVVTPTGFTEDEVQSMSRVLAVFGGVLQPSMVKTSRPEKKLLGTTHLVCLTVKSNSKLDAAKRWKIPAITVNWILSCAQEGRKVSVKEFLIDKSQWDSLPEDKKRTSSPRKSMSQIEDRKVPIELQTTRESYKLPETPTNARLSNVGSAQTPVLSSQRMREIYEEASRFKTPKAAAISDIDSPGIPVISSERVAEMRRLIDESPRSYSVPEASFDEQHSQATSGKNACRSPTPLSGMIVLLDEASLRNLAAFELKMSIEKLGGWICHTKERCSVVIMGPGPYNDASRTLKTGAQRLEKPIVGVEWIYAAIDTMSLPRFDDFPPNYLAAKGTEYERQRTFRDLENAFDDSDLNDAGGNVTENPSLALGKYHQTPKLTGEALANKSSELTIETPMNQTSASGNRTSKLTADETHSSLKNPSTTLRNDSFPDATTSTGCSNIPGTPLPAFGKSKDPLGELISRQSFNTTPKLPKGPDDEPRSLRKSQIGTPTQSSTRSVLADIETQPEEGITYGGKVGIPTSTQLHEPTNDDPNFGDLSIVKPNAFTVSPMAAEKRSSEAMEENGSGKKRFKKNRVFASPEPPPKLPRSSEKVFVLYHLDNATDVRMRAIIERLGATVAEDLSSDQSGVDPSNSTDPLMIIDPSNSRVFKKKSVLQQLASGGFIMEPVYLEDSEEAGHFLPEDDYVIGHGSKSSCIGNERFACWKRWRSQRVERGTGAFDGWKVVLFGASPEREKGHRTLLMAGGAIILTEQDIAQATHVFLAKSDVKTADRIRGLTEAHIVANEYMLHYLSNHEVDPQSYLVR